MTDERPGVEEVKQALARLAADKPMAKSRATIEIGTEAIEDFDRAVAFAEADGLAKLARAIEVAEQTDDRQLIREGQRALAAYERFRVAAAEDSHRNGERSQFSHGTSLLEEVKRDDR